MCDPVTKTLRQAGGRALGQIRVLIGVNLVIGLVVVTVASGGRYLLG